MSQLRVNYKFTLVILSIFLLMGFTMIDVPIDKEGQKKLEKAQKLNHDAQKLFDKANLLYSELAGLDISITKEEKKARNLKEKALDYQIDALEMQKEANFLEYKVFSKIIPELKLDYKKAKEIPAKVQLLEENTAELFYKAENLRNEAHRIDKNEKEARFLKLKEAQEFEKKGLDIQKQIIDIYSGKTSIVKNPQENSTLNSDIVINEDLLQAYMSFIETDNSQTAMESFKHLMYSDSLSPENLKSTWDEYLNTEQQLEDVVDIETDATAIIISNTLTEQVNELDKTDLSVSEKNRGLLNENLVYKVEIAVDKKPISQNILKKIYNSKKNVKTINDNGWNKYSIGDFKTYKEADEFRKNFGANEAFVVGYEEGVKVDLIATSEVEKTTEIISNKANLVSGLIFKVQIAADKNKMAEVSIKNLYQGSENVDLIKEDGWYKYSVGKRSSYEEASSLKKSIESKGSFIVAYNNGIKVPLKDAKEGRIKAPTSNNIVFKVQIAADIKTLSSEYLHKIYSGYKKIQQYEEDGWHKYSLGEFKTFNEANSFRAKCGVNGAFVVAFKGDSKINVLEAKKAKICYDPIIITDWLSKNNQLTYKVQIAASGKSLSASQIKNICCIEQNVYLTEEDGWFKYSIGKLNNYQKALKMKEKSGVKGAFVIVYQNNEKISLAKAFKMSK